MLALGQDHVYWTYVKLYVKRMAEMKVDPSVLADP